jgi:hypothetical protein
MLPRSIASSNSERGRIWHDEAGSSQWNRAHQSSCFNPSHTGLKEGRPCHETHSPDYGTLAEDGFSRRDTALVHTDQGQKGVSKRSLKELSRHSHLWILDSTIGQDSLIAPALCGTDTGRLSRALHGVRHEGGVAYVVFDTRSMLHMSVYDCDARTPSRGRRMQKHEVRVSLLESQPKGFLSPSPLTLAPSATIPQSQTLFLDSFGRPGLQHHVLCCVSGVPLR